MRIPRRGVALVLVICLVMVLSVFGAVLRVLTHAAYVEVDLVSAHLRAIAVGELAFGTVVARLSATRWSERWFREAPEVVTDVADGDGVYSYVLRDAPVSTANDPLAGSRHRADLLVRATSGRATVVLFWRLMVPEDSLDSLAAIVPSYFGFPPEGTPATVPGADSVTPLVDSAIAERTRNAPRSGGLVGPLGAADGPGRIGTLLGADPGPGVIDGVPPPGGGPGVPHPPPGLPPPIPVGAAPAPLTLDGLWVSPYQDIQLSAADPTLHHARDYTQMRESGGVVTGHTRFIDDDGNLLTEWDFTAPRAGSRLQFGLVNQRTVITGPHAPGTFSFDYTLNASMDAMDGTLTYLGGTKPAHLERVR